MIEIKRGDTFDFQGPITDLSGEPVDLTDWTVASQLRSRDGTLIQNFACSFPDRRAGVVRLFAETATWPLGTHQVDLQFTDPSGKVISTPTDQIKVKQGVTD